MLSFSILTVLIKIKNEIERMKCGIQIIGLDFEIRYSLSPRTAACWAKQEDNESKHFEFFLCQSVFHPNQKHLGNTYRCVCSENYVENEWGFFFFHFSCFTVDKIQDRFWSNTQEAYRGIKVMLFQSIYFVLVIQS